MPLSDLPLPMWFLFFMLIFVLIGLLPAGQRTVTKILRYLKKTYGRPEEPATADPKTELKSIFANQQTAQQLNDFEFFVLRQLALTGIKGLSRKHIKDKVYLEPLIVKKTLRSLHSRGLIRFHRQYLFGKRFYLSEKGHEYSLEQGFIFTALEGNERP